MDKVALLSASPLFELLSTTELEYVAELSRPRQVKAGEVVFQEGELGDALFVIASGEVEVMRKDGQGALRTITAIGSPQFFGEMSLIDKEYRSATVRAKTECTLLHLTAENLTAFRRQHRDGFTFIIINIARTLSARLREANTRLAARN